MKIFSTALAAAAAVALLGLAPLASGAPFGFAPFGAAAHAQGPTTYELDAIAYQTGPGQVADTELDLYAPASLAAPAAIVVYAPTGYGLALGQPAGTQIGTIDGGSLTIGGVARDLSGTIVTDDPAKHTSDPCSPGAHAGVWILNATAAGITAPIPMYVDPTSGPETALGAYRLLVCLPSPYVDPSAGGAPLGARLTEADLDFPAIFTNPAGANVYIWRALVVPYTVGTATKNAAGTTEVRSDVPIPYRISLKASKDKKGTTAIITGSVVAAGHAVGKGIPVQLMAGTTRDASKLKPLGRATTTKAGKFTFRFKPSKTLYVWAFTPILTSECDTTVPAAAPAGCALESLSPAFAPGVIKVAVVKKKK
jgi:hypothetical protein